MKTYLFDTINRYKRFSDNLDVKTILCNKVWWVFNDSGEKEVYIFQKDGSLIISLSGKVTKANWQYLSANQALIISGNNQSYMVHPAFKDDMLLALQIDGTSDVAFLIDENQLNNYKFKKYNDIINYFKTKEKIALENNTPEIIKQKFEEHDEEHVEISRDIRTRNKNIQQKTIQNNHIPTKKDYFIRSLVLTIVGCILVFIAFVSREDYSTFVIIGMFAIGYAIKYYNKFNEMGE